ncbi:adhesin [Herbiconiux sp. VKM Ac-2851]|uniref:adhesin n=1 Tax=Herbiconiux sp. VKM Ac-2851 TaxID=2739025 RepID=UPI00156307AF|nr:adhesin [Herbiconiux sp. VKM Ac-2851]NQX37049.1 adhesin [Herbiconiux sp. VKM Ac-2851]
MLTVTENAATVIKGLAARVEGAEHPGLRIGASNDAAGFAVELTAEPVAGDEVIERDGSRVFLDQTAVPKLSDKELDALIEEGSVRFSLRNQS